MSNTPQRVAQGLYSPLPFQDSIRLFRFKNTFSRTSIALELQVFRLSDHPPYRAVSYTWGSVADQRQILINGWVVVVRKNLWDALEAFKYHRHLRQMKDAFRFKYPIVWFWADILCIRQDSVDEKNHQVSQIDRIFRAATCVWAWLGTHHRIEQYLSGIHEGRFKGSHECPLDEVEYFTRTWTVQECCLARELVLFAGRHVSCKFDSIRNPNYSDINSIAGGIMTLRRKGIRDFPYKSLLICIRMFHLTKCTDPLDKVFALQSMVDPKSRCKVDYRMDAAVLYWQVLMANDDSCDFHQLMTLASALNVTIQDAGSRTPQSS
jgi:Heterokaryon incompatibility protein (HET)